MSSLDKVTLQDKFRHYLKSYRRRHGLTQGALGKLLGYNDSHIRKFEGLRPDNRLIRTFEFLERLAQLENLSIRDFIHYILSSGTVPNDHAAGGLYPWQSTLLKSFENVSLRVRRRFVHGVLHRSLGEGVSNLELLLDIVCDLEPLDSETLQAVARLAQTLNRGRPSKADTLSSPDSSRNDKLGKGHKAPSGKPDDSDEEEDD